MRSCGSWMSKVSAELKRCTIWNVTGSTDSVKSVEITSSSGTGAVPSTVMCALVGRLWGPVETAQAEALTAATDIRASAVRAAVQRERARSMS